MRFVAKKIVNNRAFTFTELLITLTIMAVATSIWVELFSNYESRARQGEAKIALAQIYQGEKTFYSEWKAYIEDLAAIEFVPEEGKRHYTIGWRSATVKSSVTNYMGKIGFPYSEYSEIPSEWAFDSKGNVQCDRATALAGLIDATMRTNANIQKYTVKARGVLQKGIPCDEWQINQDKELKNTVRSL